MFKSIPFNFPACLGRNLGHSCIVRRLTDWKKTDFESPDRESYTFWRQRICSSRPCHFSSGQDYIRISLMALTFDLSFTVPDINECEASPCKNGATCENLSGSYRCKCKSGYTGKNCEEGRKRINWLSYSFLHYFSTFNVTWFAHHILLGTLCGRFRLGFDSGAGVSIRNLKSHTS